MEKQTATNKRIAKNTIALYIRMFLLLLIGLYTSRATLEIFGVEDFGIYNLVGGIITMAVFIRSSMTLSVERFLAYAIDCMWSIAVICQTEWCYLIFIYILSGGKKSMLNVIVFHNLVHHILGTLRIFYIIF